MWICRNSSLIGCEKAWQMLLQIETPTWGRCPLQQTHHEMPSGIWIGIRDRLWHFFCKSLVFGFVDADSFRYFDNIYNPQIKFISKYLRPMVIDCKRPDQIPWILWGGIHHLSQILHYPGSDSIAVFRKVGTAALHRHFGLFSPKCRSIILSSNHIQIA